MKRSGKIFLLALVVSLLLPSAGVLAGNAKEIAKVDKDVGVVSRSVIAVVECGCLAVPPDPIRQHVVHGRTVAPRGLGGGSVRRS